MTCEISAGPPAWIAARSEALRPGQTLVAGLDATASGWHGADGGAARERLARRPGRLVAFLHADDVAGRDVGRLLDTPASAADESIAFLVPRGHRDPNAARDVVGVRSFLCSPEFFQRHHARILAGDPPAYGAAEAALAHPIALRALQWPARSARASARGDASLLDPPVTWLVPHRGDPAFLDTCLAHLRRAAARHDAIWVCLDEPPAPAHTDFVRAYPEVRFWRCSPDGVGPYVARHVLGLAATTDILIFQDSDDVPLHGRRAALVAAIRADGLDMVGSHELRLEDRERRVMGLRFPEDINAALRRDPNDLHVFLHPTTAVRVAALRAIGGFSTVRTFATDMQFLYRAHFSLRCRNLDDFLYLRRKRPGSLTTSPGTGHGELPRMLLENRWRRDFTRVSAGELSLADSSLTPEHHPSLAEIRLEELSPATPCRNGSQRVK
ncbi:MAG TPA: glycosyltransferase [Candidatus Dormibacteraeota bacterium]|nr:glycosyltransferase [Candidatus Dormibacteraeota bacterium]